MNLLQETLDILKSNSLTPKDVLWVGSKEIYSNWQHFTSIAKDINYDDGYGIEEIATDLLIVGNDWWLERHEYDGSEWWEFKKLPIKPKEKIYFKYLSRNQFKEYYYGVDMKLKPMNITKQK